MSSFDEWWNEIGAFLIDSKMRLLKKAYEAGRKEGMERAAEIAGELHISGGDREYRYGGTNEDAADAIRKEIENEQAM